MLFVKVNACKCHRDLIPLPPFSPLLSPSLPPAKVLLLRQPRAHCLFRFSHSRNSDDRNMMTAVYLLMIESVSVAK